MKRLIFILLLTTLLLALTSVVVYASPPPQSDTSSSTQDGNGDDGSPGLDEAIGTLGLYAALMAVLAVGTEVVIDTTRPVFGLQRKTTTAEAFSKLNKWLPGATQELGLSEEAQTRINATIKELETVTEDFQDKAAEAKRILEGEWPNLLKELASENVENVLKYHWDTIDKKLEDKGLDAPKRAEVRNWLEATLGQIRGIQVADVPDQLALLNGVMANVAERRNEIQGPARKVWRQVRDFLVRVGKSERMKDSGIRHLFFIPAYLEAAWARFWGKLKLEVDETCEDAINKLGTAQHKTVNNLQEAARRLLDEDSQNRQEEENRVKWLRIVSVVAGIALAYILRIDSLELLEPILQKAAETFKSDGNWFTIKEVIKEATGNTYYIPLPILEPLFDALLALTPGIVLSGLGAAAGSGFWHDRLDNLRSAKEAVQTVEEIKKSVVVEEEK